MDFKMHIGQMHFGVPVNPNRRIMRWYQNRAQNAQSQMHLGPFWDANAQMANPNRPTG